MGQASELRLPRREEISSNIFLFFNYGKKSGFYSGILLDFEGSDYTLEKKQIKHYGNSYLFLYFERSIFLINYILM